MGVTADLDFTYDPFSPEAMSDPHSLYPLLRERAPAYFIAEYDAYVFTRFADVWAGFMDAEHFSEAEGQLFSREGLLVHHRGDPPAPRIEPDKTMFLFLDPPVHTGFRKALAAPFLKGAINKLEDRITSLVRARLEALLPLGRFDLNVDLASSISVVMAAEVMGLQLEDPVHVNEMVNRMVAREPGRAGMTDDGMKARIELMRILSAEAARRRAGAGAESPIIDPLLQDGLIGRPQRDDEIASDILAILVGGAETLPKVFSGGLLELQRRPDQLAAVATAPATHTKPAVEEMLRYNAPAQWFGRTVRKAVTLGGVDLEPGQRVILSIAAANRDHREFEDPDEFIWNRKARRMLSFGVGPHFCIGIHLARLELQVLLREFLNMAKAFTIHPEQGEWATSEFQIGWLKLPVTVHRTA